MCGSMTTSAPEISGTSHNVNAAVALFAADASAEGDPAPIGSTITTSPGFTTSAAPRVCGSKLPSSRRGPIRSHRRGHIDDGILLLRPKGFSYHYTIQKAAGDASMSRACPALPSGTTALATSFGSIGTLLLADTGNFVQIGVSMTPG